MAGEQVTANMANFGQQLADWVRGIPIKQLQRVVYGLLLVWLISSFLQLVWLLIPQSEPIDESTAGDQAVAVVPSAAKADITRLQSFNLFGQVGEQQVVAEAAAPLPEEEELKAVKTKLNLKLQGIVSASESSSAVAIIVYQGKQEQYHIGDKLPEGNRVSLAKVLNDHVILDNKGQYESLWLYDDSDSEFKATESSRSPRRNNRSSSANIKDLRNNVSATRLAKDYRQRLYKNPKSLAEVLRIAPAQENGQMVGYRVSPGRDRNQFSELGFKANDIVTSINDINLNEPSQALEVYKLMRTATEANFTVMRNGRTLQLMVALGEGSE